MKPNLNIWKRGFALLLCLVAVLIGTGTAVSGEPAEQDWRSGAQESALKADARAAEMLNDILVAWGAESPQTWLSGALAQDAGNSPWYAIALAQSGEVTDLTVYEAALRQYLSQTTVRSAASRQKYALALIACGSADGFIRSTLEDSIGKQGIMSLVFGLHLLNNGYTASADTVQSVRDAILSKCLEDGGWAVTGTHSDVDVTAMTLQALAPLCESDAEVRAAVEQALDLLSSRQLETGDFTSYGRVNAESAAQVLTALAVLNVDWREDERFLKNGKDLIDVLLTYRLEDGRFCHADGEGFSSAATEQIFFALTAVQRQESGRSSVYLMDLRCPEKLPEAGGSTGTDEPSADTKEPAGQPSTLPGGADPSGDEVPEKAPENRMMAKLCLCAGFFAGGLVVFVVLLVRKRANWKNLLALLVVDALVIVCVFCINIQSPEEHDRGGDVTKEHPVGTVTVTIRCDTVAGKTDAEHIPQDGIILASVTMELGAGDTVYEILSDAARVYHLRVDSQAGYVEGIQGLYEFDFGAQSGWTYRVNGEVPSVACTDYRLADGDRIEWLYTCQMGNDLD